MATNAITTARNWAQSGATLEVRNRQGPLKLGPYPVAWLMASEREVEFMWADQAERAIHGGTVTKVEAQDTAVIFRVNGRYLYVLEPILDLQTRRQLNSWAERSRYSVQVPEGAAIYERVVPYHG